MRYVLLCLLLGASLFSALRLYEQNGKLVDKDNGYEYTKQCTGFVKATTTNKNYKLATLEDDYGLVGMDGFDLEYTKSGFKNLEIIKNNGKNVKFQIYPNQISCWDGYSVPTKYTIYKNMLKVGYVLFTESTNNSIILRNSYFDIVGSAYLNQLPDYLLATNVSKNSEPFWEITVNSLLPPFDNYNDNLIIFSILVTDNSNVSKYCFDDYLMLFGIVVGTVILFISSVYNFL